MKQLSFIPKAFWKIAVVPGLLSMLLVLGACEKQKLGIAPRESAEQQTRAQMRHSIQRILRGFVTAQAGGSSQQAISVGGGNIFSDVTMTKTTYAPPNQRSVYTWSSPSTPTTQYSFSESESSGGGLGQLSYAGKSFDYNYVLSIKVAAGSSDPDFSVSANSLALRAIVAIDGDISEDDFTLRNMAIFIVVGTATEGNFELGNYDDGATETIAIGELLDFSAVPTPTLGMMDNAKFYYTSGGHMNVSETSFEMGSDAKVKDIDTGTEYLIEGSLTAE